MALGEVVAQASEDVETWEAIADVLEQARDLLGVDLTLLSQLTDDYAIVRAAAGDPGSFGLSGTTAIPRHETYCQAMVDGRIDQVVQDTTAEPAVAYLAVTTRGQIGRYVGVPVHLPDGTLYGALCGLGHRADPTLGPRDARFLGFLASMVEAELGHHHHASVRQQILLTRLHPFLDGTGISMVFQPIRELSDGATVGFEALARFPGEPRRPPDAWFADAAEVGVGVGLELLAARASLAALDQVPDDAFLSVNVSAETACSDQLAEVLDRCDPTRVVLEITEHAVVRDYKSLAACLSAWRRRGVRLAVDDAGAGVANFHHVVELAPELIKMDVSLTRGIDTSPARAAVAGAMATLAAATGAMLIAEGIETAAERDALGQFGIRYGQGFLLGEPGRLPPCT